MTRLHHPEPWDEFLREVLAVDERTFVATVGSGDEARRLVDSVSQHDPSWSREFELDAHPLGWPSNRSVTLRGVGPLTLWAILRDGVEGYPRNDASGDVAFMVCLSLIRVHSFPDGTGMVRYDEGVKGTALRDECGRRLEQAGVVADGDREFDILEGDGHFEIAVGLLKSLRCVGDLVHDEYWVGFPPLDVWTDEA